MKKIIFFTLFLLLWVYHVDANWYGNHNKVFTYGTTWNPILECDYDWDSTWWFAPWYSVDRAVARNNSSSTLIPHNPASQFEFTNSNDSTFNSPLFRNSLVWNMRCLYWDAAVPTNPTSLTINPSNQDWTSCTKIASTWYCKNNINISYNWNWATDAWWSWLNSYLLRLQRVSDGVNMTNPNPNTWRTWSSAWLFSISWLSQWTYNNMIKSRDVALNENSQFFNWESLVIDTVAPAWGSFTINWWAIQTDNINVVLNVTCPTDSNPWVQVAFWNSTNPTNWQSCTNWNYGHTLTSTFWSKTVYMRFRDAASNTTWNINRTIQLVPDMTPPTLADLSITTPNNILANNNYHFSWIYVDNNWWTTVVALSWYYERFNNPNLTWALSLTSTDGYFNFNWDLRNVDLDRLSNWSREYTLTITKICDQAWNCWNWTFNHNFNVYANTLNITTKTVSTNQLEDNANIADWTTKNLSITLRDTYLNAIVPATWIWRTIDIKWWDINNTMYLNQYTRTWVSSVFLNRTTEPSNFTNRFWIWLTSNTSFTWELSTNWVYTYLFKFYTPTSNQNNSPISDLSSEFSIWAISFDINWTLWAIPNQTISNSNIDAKFSPIYYTSILWDIVNEWLSEGFVQSWSIQISKNWTTLTTSNNIYLEFWSWNTNQTNSKLNLKYWVNSSSVNFSVGEWNWNYTTFNNNFWVTAYPFYTKLQLQTWATINDIQNSYISTHIWYSLDWKDIVYNSDIYWKDSYWGIIWSWNTYANALKVIWNTYSNKYNEIISWQTWSWVILVNWEITKSSLKADVRKKVYELIRNIVPSNWSMIIGNLDFSDDEDGREILNWSLLYFWKLNWQNVTLSAWSVSWNKSIIIEWWNLYINWNITTTWTNSVLWIAVLKDENWNWWNIYINPNVSYIRAIMYADKSLISYDWTNELWGDTSFTLLKNQLYIYGSVFSENTIGWSRAFPIKCPYYVSNCSSIEEAQKYDLNYLRRYYLKDTNSDWIGDTSAWWWISYFSSESPNYKYPIVIEYNPLIQSQPPVIFKK